MKVIGIDLGTANILIYMRGKGIILREPSVVAYNTSKGSLVSIGEEAKNMVGKTPGHVVAVRPMRDGVIADYKVTEEILSYFVKKSKAKVGPLRPTIFVCIPYGITKVESRAVEEAAINAGARAAYLVEEPIAAAIGAGLDIMEPQGNMIVDIGGGTTEVAVMSLGGIVVSCSIRAAGDKMDEAIITYLKKKYSMIIGERTAEKIKMTIGSAMKSADAGCKAETMVIRGLDQVSGLPHSLTISSDEIAEAISEQVQTIVDSVKNTLELTPPELAADVAENGIYLSGGGAMLKNLDTLLYKETGIKSIVASNPLDCVANGLGSIVEESAKFRNLKFYSNDD
ncbi:MAG: rod shape-determining protein [Clostridiales bacterium]|nr:rod shape-determining protein [Clostridiales bacterium]